MRWNFRKADCELADAVPFMEETTPVLSVQTVMSGLCPPACAAMATAVRRTYHAPSTPASNTSAKAKCPFP
jgi:hypothetical protein